jgi:iron-sulfur cluster assembly protein
VDKKSYLFLKGCVLDYDTSLMSKGFMLSNPNAKASCGCGQSFSV